MNLGSSPAATIFASQYRDASGSEPLRDLMKAEMNVLGLTKYNSLRYEKLIGDKQGLSSVRINDQYRIEFEEYITDGETIATICNITDLSNQYD